jgi:hypothetical protein
MALSAGEEAEDTPCASAFTVWSESADCASHVSNASMARLPRQRTRATRNLVPVISSLSDPWLLVPRNSAAKNRLLLFCTNLFIQNEPAIMQECSTLAYIVHELARFYNTDRARMGEL